MFKLFKKQTAVAPTVEAAVAELPVTKSKYPQVVQDIHNEFFTAGENILAEANSLLSELEKKDVAKGKRLAALGFGKTREAVAAIETENKLATTKEIAELVLYYQINYPNNKFITEEQVKTICEKYGLVCGNTSAYKGFVPEGKLDNIEKFKLRQSDVPFLVVYDNREEIVGYISKDDCDTELIDYLSRTNGNYIWITSSLGDRINYSFKTPKYDTYKHLEFVKAIRETPSLKICAPLKDMELSSRQQVVGYKIQNIPDPVVLQPVKGGYLIIECWGDEASDELVVNQKMN